MNAEVGRVWRNAEKRYFNAKNAKRAKGGERK
jgi:hypothetical protein